MRFKSLLTSLLVVSALAAAACGGGGGGDDATPGERITDPAKVPSSTPIQSPVLYTIRGDTISTSGGSSTTVAGSATPNSSSPRTYVVKSGDSCSSIAASLGVTVDALIRANRSIDDNCTNLRIDDQLRVPSASTPAAGTTPAPGTTPRPGTGGKTYTVRSGDTCGAIAANQGVSIENLVAANSLDANCTGLQIGQVLTIP